MSELNGIRRSGRQKPLYRQPPGIWRLKNYMPISAPCGRMSAEYGYLPNRSSRFVYMRFLNIRPPYDH